MVMKCGKSSPVAGSSTGKYRWCLRITITSTSLGRARNSGLNEPRIGVAASTRFTTSSSKPPGSPEEGGTTPLTDSARATAPRQIASRRLSMEISISSPAKSVAWCAAPVTSTTGVALFLMSRVVSPEGTPAATNGMWCSPCIARSHRTGLENVSSEFQRMALGKFSPPITPGSASRNTSTAPTPTVTTFAQTYSPSFSKSSGPMPFFAQKPSTALVGVTPSFSNARDCGGPRSLSSPLLCAAASFATRTTVRRGVAPTVTPSWVRPEASSVALIAPSICAAHALTSAAGSSSVPSSMKKSAALVGGGFLETTGAAIAAISHSPSGNPSSSRRVTHSFADSRASFLMLAKSFWRSVTPTAPLASRMLNACDAFKRLSNAGNGNRRANIAFASSSASSNRFCHPTTDAASMLYTLISYSFCASISPYVKWSLYRMSLK
mmetsp:Transcript_778/g.2983  ORF Transcript_778/g.2983 Transcript_778/m.2983 type:complete len:437 (+) Transcript_778:2465-3775(+)